MASENDNNKRRNAGRLQSPSPNVAQSAPLDATQIKEQIKRGMEKEAQGKGGKKGVEAINESKPIKDLKEDITKRAEEKKRQDNANFTEDRRREISNNKIQIRETDKRQAKALGHKSEAERKADKEVDKKLKEMGAMQGSYVKRKIVSKVTGKVISETAYAASQKMAAEANKGGVGAIVIILITLMIAVLIDTVDILMEIGLAAAIVSAVGAIPGAIIGFFIWLINFLLSLVIVFFWMIVLGGGHKKWFWKLLTRLIIFVLFVEAIPVVDLLPWTVFTVCWNWYDFAKSIKQAKKDSEELEIVFKKTGKLSKNAANY